MPDREPPELREDIETSNAEWFERQRAHASTPRLPRISAAGWCGTMALLILLVAGAAATAQVFGPPTPLNTNAGSDSGVDRYPQVTTDGAGSWVAVWSSADSLGEEADILVARSTDDGASWTAPAALNTNAGSDSGDDERPQVTTDGAGKWVAVWHSSEPDVPPGDPPDEIGGDYDILVASSTDNGASWTPPAALNTNAGSDSGDDYCPQVTTDGAGNWVAVWLSDDSLGGAIGTDYDILVARSTDNGASWTAPAVLNWEAGSDLGDDLWPQVATDGAGNWVAVWFHIEMGGPPSYVFAARSTDNGVSWSWPVQLNTLSAYSHTPDVTTDGAGNWVAVWEGAASPPPGAEDFDIRVARSTDDGLSWSAPATLNTNAGSDTGDDFHPRVTTDGAGKWVAVWESDDSLGGPIGTDDDILVARSTDAGASWTAPAALNTNAGSDSGNDERPQVTTDGAGKWVAVWHSNGDLGGTIGTDHDILVATGWGTNIPALAPHGLALAALLLTLAARGWLRRRRHR